MRSGDRDSEDVAGAGEVAALRAALGEEAALRAAAEAHAEALAAEVAALRVDNAALQAAHAALEPLPTALTSLPRPLACAVLLLLPPRDRARCSAVCRAWRCLGRERAAWATLHFSAADYDSPRNELRSEHLLGAAARAGAALRVLHLSQVATERAALRQVLRGAPALEELSLGTLFRKIPEYFSSNDDWDPQPTYDHELIPAGMLEVGEVLEELSAGAPLRRVRLDKLVCEEGSVEWTEKDLHPGGLFGADLCVDFLHVKFSSRADQGVDEAVDKYGVALRALFAAVAAPHVRLRTLRISARLSAATLAALVDAAAAAPQLQLLEARTSQLSKSRGFADQMERLKRLRPDLKVAVKL